MMRRRTFNGVTLASLIAGPFMVKNARAALVSTQRQAIELRRYSFVNEAKLMVFAEFAATALGPALHRAGIAPVGIFRLMKNRHKDVASSGTSNPAPVWVDDLAVVMLLPHISAESIFLLSEKLATDATYVAAAQAVLGTPMKDPVYTRVETQLMLAFTHCPEVKAPVHSATRIFQLRIYESHNEQKALRKIEMFNEGGEIEIFRQCGMRPVFFGQSVAGTRMPNLTYMLGFDTSEARDAAWATFLKHPDWLRIKADPAYVDTVSNITNVMLRPLPGSVI